MSFYVSISLVSLHVLISYVGRWTLEIELGLEVESKHGRAGLLILSEMQKKAQLG